MATIKEVARACGVSIATVSNILNNKGRVGEETRKKILRTADEMGYVPNMVARNLKQRHTKTVGIITEDLTVFNSADIIDGINEYLDEKGYSFLIGNLRLNKKYGIEFYHHENYHTQVEEEFRLMKSKQVDGVIYIGAHCRKIKCIPADYENPIVVAYGISINKALVSVTYNDEKAAYDATTTMINNGHRKIGVIGGEKESDHTKGRQKGYERALTDAGITYRPELIAYCDWSREKGYQACKNMVQEGIDSIFAMSDVMAMGVYDYANEMGIEVGRDISLIGFDNREISQAFHPELTTMSIPLREIGIKAAETLVTQIENKEFIPQHIYQMNCQLIARESL